MGIARGMDVALGTVKCGGHFHQLNALAAGNAPGCARRQLGITRLVQQRGQPAHFQVRPALNQGVGTVQFDDETRFGVEKMRIFGWLG